MTLKQTLQRARDILQAHQIESAELTAEVLLRHSLDFNRVQLYQKIDDDLNIEAEIIFQSYLERHLKGEPVAYITGHKEFFGNDFIVDNRVLIPRPETELLVEKSLELAGEKHIATVADIGTGCGAIAISLALKLGNVKIYATDISALALELAVRNCERNKVLDKICFLHGNLLEPLPGPVDLIVANLPYVKVSDISKSQSLGFEPAVALKGGIDGLSVIREFCSQAKEKVQPGSSVLIEIGIGQSNEVASLLQHCFPKGKIENYRDFAGIERVISLEIPA